MQKEDGRPPLPGAGHVEDYTTPFLVVTGVLCFAILLVLWAIIGFAAAVFLALGTDILMRVATQTR